MATKSVAAATLRMVELVHGKSVKMGIAIQSQADIRLKWDALPQEIRDSYLASIGEAATREKSESTTVDAELG